MSGKRRSHGRSHSRTVLVLVVVIVLGGVLGGLYAVQRSLVYFPLGGPLPPAAEVLPGGEDVTVTTDDGLRLGAWYFPAADPDAPAVLFAPGNGGNRSLRVPLARELVARGFSVLVMDYRGYGGNPGSPSEEGLAHDVRAARRHLVEHEGVPAAKLLYFGESLGCGVISELATEHPPAGMLLRSPFVDLASVGAAHYPWLPVRLLLRDRYPVMENVRRLRGVPVTVVWGGADRIVPAEQSRAVAEAAGAAAVRVTGSDHNDLELLAGPAVIQAFVDLARRAVR